jgi:hypothetical protein
LGSGNYENGGGNYHERGHEGGREMAGRKRTGARARIGGVQGSVREAIESHGGTAGGDHSDHDPQQLMEGRKARGGEHSSAKSEWESEDGVLPLDHLEGDAEIVKDGHGKIVKQSSCQLPVASSRFFRSPILLVRSAPYHALGGSGSVVKFVPKNILDGDASNECRSR